MGTPAEGAREAGWLLGPFPEGGLWQPLSLAALRQVEWSAILLQSGTLGTLLLIALLSFLLNASGLELAIRQDVDLNRELKVAGLANALGGLGGGPVGYHALSLSALSHRMTPVGRATGVVVALVYALVLLVGASFLSFFPTFILGGVLLFLGLDFLVTWLVDTWSRLSRSEYMIVVLIALVMAVVGVLEGVALGVFLAMVLFIVDYGRASPIRHVLTGETYRSTVDRPEVQRHVLQQYGDRIYILQLQRFIFFGTANRLLDTVRQRVARIDAPLPCFIILDFHRVSGLDASAVSSFDKMRQLAARRDIELIFSGLRAEMRSRLVTLAESGEGEAGLRIFQDLDHALERCEEQILSGNVAAIGAVELDLQRPPHAIRHLLEYMSPQRVEAGEYLIQQGDYLEGFYFLHQGGLTVQLGSADGQVVRLRKMRPGVFIGELSLYTGAPASASVMADEPSTVYFLSGSELARLEEDAPAVATVIHRQIAKLVSERLLDATRTISNLRM